LFCVIVHRAIGPAMDPSFVLLGTGLSGPPWVLLLCYRAQGCRARHGSFIGGIGHRAIGPAMGPPFAVFGTVQLGLPWVPRLQYWAQGYQVCHGLHVL